MTNFNGLSEFVTAMPERSLLIVVGTKGCGKTTWAHSLSNAKIVDEPDIYGEFNSHLFGVAVLVIDNVETSHARSSRRARFQAAITDLLRPVSEIRRKNQPNESVTNTRKVVILTSDPDGLDWLFVPRVDTSRIEVAA